MAEWRRGVAKTSKPLALVIAPDVPVEATMLLEEAGHLLYTLEQSLLITKVDAIVGAKCWRMPSGWWLKDGQLSPQAKLMLKAVTAQAYPEKPKGKKRA